MLLEAKSEDLLYVADEGADGVFMYSHPAEQPVGTLSLDHPKGECVDEHPYNCAVDPNSGRIAVLFQVNGYYTSASRVRNAS